MRRRSRKALGGAMLWLLLVGPTRGGVVIAVGDITLTPGGSGFVPVTIRGNPGDQPLDFTGYQFQITTATGRLLEFQDSPVPDPTFASPDYVFAGNSADEAVLSGSGVASTTSTTNDTFIGGDFTADGMSVVPSTSAMLLVDLPVTAFTAIAGDTFTIGLIPSADPSPTGLDGNTGFSAAGAFAPFDSLTGTVTIAQSVPEPGGPTLLGIGCLALLGCACRHRWRSGADGLPPSRPTIPRRGNPGAFP